MKEKYTVDIGGIEMNILSDESEEYVRGLARLIDQKVNKMVVSNKRCSTTEAAFVCCLEYLDDKLKTALAMETLQKQRDSYIREIEALRRENLALKKGSALTDARTGNEAKEGAESK